MFLDEVYFAMKPHVIFRGLCFRVALR